MARGSKPTTKQQPANSLLSYFKPTTPTPTKPPRSNRPISKSPSVAPAINKGKRKIDRIELLSDDSDIEIIETPKFVKKEEKARPVKQPKRVLKEKDEADDAIAEARGQGANERPAFFLASEEEMAVDQVEEKVVVVEERIQIVVSEGAEEGHSELASKSEESIQDPKPVTEWDDDTNLVRRDRLQEGDDDDDVADQEWGEESMRTTRGNEDPNDVAAFIAEFVRSDGEDEERKQREDGNEVDDEIQIDLEDDSEPRVVQPPPATQAKCPVCSKTLAMLPEKERELHVNICLDGPGTPTGFLPRITSLFRSKLSTPTAPVASTSKSTATKPEFPLKAAPNAFTTLMASHAEDVKWKAAEKSDNMKGRMPKGEKKEVPFYKWVDGFPFTVDAFKYGNIDGCKGYFLSHAHSDHYQQLNSSWKNGPIYCSLTTANLIKLKLKVSAKWLKVLPMNKTVTIEGTKVTLLDANHCPGSVLFLFEGPHNDPKSPWTKKPSRIFRHLHCGDFRASPAHLNHPCMIGKKIDLCYLDTTYLDPKYCFPAQELVIEACAELVRTRVIGGDKDAFRSTGGKEQKEGETAMKGWLAKIEDVKEEVKQEMVVEVVDDADDKLADGKGKGKEKEKKPERLLVVVGTYSIGKERIVKRIAQSLETKIYCDAPKLALFKAQDDPVLHSLLTDDPLKGQVHVVFLSHINQEYLSNYLAQYRNKVDGFTTVIGIRPTGWTYRPEAKGEKLPKITTVLERECQRKYSPAGMYPQKDSTPNCLAFGVPYSEHSSFFELTCFALSLDYVRMIPTVNVGTPSSRAKMKEWFTRWEQEKKRREASGIPRMVQPRSEDYW